jgi:hypothetical protein
VPDRPGLVLVDRDVDALADGKARRIAVAPLERGAATEDEPAPMKPSPCSTLRSMAAS